MRKEVLSEELNKVMPRFELTARSEMNHNGMHVGKGDTISVNIPVSGIQPNNLFGNSRCSDSLHQQFSVNGLDLPKNSPWLNGGHWDVKMVK